jgi:hypothetical protein
MSFLTGCRSTRPHHTFGQILLVPFSCESTRGPPLVQESDYGSLSPGKRRTLIIPDSVEIITLTALFSYDYGVFSFGQQMGQILWRLKIISRDRSPCWLELTAWKFQNSINGSLCCYRSRLFVKITLNIYSCETIANSSFSIY